MTTSTAIRSKIRTQIQPMQHARTFKTGWMGEQTFEAIAEEIQPVAAAQFRKYGVFSQDIPDCIQSGLMRLWTDLLDDPELLADKHFLFALFRVVAGSQSNNHIRYHDRYVSFADFVADSEWDADEYGISGLSNPSEWWRATERWAVWASKVDFRLDITEAIVAMAEKYAADFKCLAALYILTTGVDPLEALAGLNLAKSQVYYRMAEIREQLQALLREYEPIAPRTWQERLADGETAPYLEIVDKYMDTPLALYAIYTLTTDAEVRKFARDEKQRKMITYYRKKCLKQIEAAYGKAASF